LKACGVVTGPAAKRNPVDGRNIAFTPSAAQKLAAQKLIGLVLGFRGLVVPPAQLIHEMLEVGRQTRGLWLKVLLQPFAHGVADRSAGLVIDAFAVVVDSAIHGEFRFSSFQRYCAALIHGAGNGCGKLVKCVSFW
jgi:hypothetical protein